MEQEDMVKHLVYSQDHEWYHQVIEAKWVCPICMAMARKWNKQHLARRCCHKHLIHMHHLRADGIDFELVKRRVNDGGAQID